MNGVVYTCFLHMWANIWRKCVCMNGAHTERPFHIMWPVGKKKWLDIFIVNSYYYSYYLNANNNDDDY